MKTSIKHLLIILMSMVSAVVSAQSFTLDGLEYNVTEAGKCELIACHSQASTIQIPETVTYLGKQMSVVKIGKSAFADNTTLENLTLPTALESIGAYAFKNCSGIKKLILPVACVEFGTGAFMNVNMKIYPYGATEADKQEWDVILPMGDCGAELFSGASFRRAKVYMLYSRMFQYCMSLERVKVETLPAYSYGPKYIPSNAFDGCKTLKVIDLPDYEYIGNEAFRNTGLQSIELSDDVIRIGEDAFAGSEIQSIHLPANVTEVCHHAFMGSLLTTVTGGDGVIEIGWSAFSRTEKLTSIPYMPKLEVLGRHAFSGSGIRSFIFGYNFDTNEKGYQFDNCSNLQDIICLCAHPPFPSFGSTPVFEGCNVDFIDVHVPTERIEDYKAKLPWSQFKYFYDDAEEYLEKYMAGVDDIEAAPDVNPVRISADAVRLEYGIGKSIHVYDTMGHMCYSSRHYDGEDIPLGKGLYILTVDGKATKIKI